MQCSSRRQARPTEQHENNITNHLTTYHCYNHSITHNLQQHCFVQHVPAPARLPCFGPAGDFLPLGPRYLPLTECSRCLREFVLNNDDPLFCTALKADFPEGWLLVEAFSRRGGSLVVVPSYKKMYLAFQNRFKLQTKHVGNHVTIPWRQSSTYLTVEEFREHQEENEDTEDQEDNEDTEDASNNEDDNLDVKALVFIFRLWDCPESCCFLSWEKDTDGEHNRTGNDGLERDEAWYDDADYCVELPPLKNEIYRSIDNDYGGSSEKCLEVLREVASTYRLSVHAIDLHTCQVLTLLDNAPGRDVEGLDTTGADIYGHEDDTPKLYGVPSRGSPFYRHMTCADYYTLHRWGFCTYPHVESLQWMNSLDIGHYDNETNDHTVYLDRIRFSPFPDNSSIRNRYSISSFLRALMREKCFDLRSVDQDAPQDMSFVFHEELDSSRSSLQPPEWVKEEKILDTVLSFVPFEDQVATIRLVCKLFKASALRQLEKKLLDTDWLPIAFTRYAFTRYDGALFRAGWFRADARRGWSDGFVSRSDVIESSLWMASCRCIESCEDKDSCPGTRITPLYRAGGKTKTLDTEQARRLLIKQGQVNLTPNFPDGQKRSGGDFNSVQICFEKREGKSLYQLCQRVHEAIDKEVDYPMEPEDLRRHYGISIEMGPQQFLRSLFLVFTDGASIAEGHFPDTTFAMAKSHVQAEDGRIYIRMKQLFRFHTATHQPIEICLESRHYIY